MPVNLFAWISTESRCTSDQGFPMISSWVYSKIVYESSVDHCLEIWGPFWEGFFLWFVLHSWAREFSVEQGFSSEVLHLQVLFIIFLDAVDEQLLQPLLNSSVNPALHPLLASVPPSCYWAVHCVKNKKKGVDAMGTSLDAPFMSSHVHFSSLLLLRRFVFLWVRWWKVKCFCSWKGTRSKVTEMLMRIKLH